MSPLDGSVHFMHLDLRDKKGALMDAARNKIPRKAGANPKIHGGRRPGAGRPKGSGRFGEVTERVRVPVSLVGDVLRFVESKAFKLPLYSCTVQAGSPAFADDAIDDRIDLNQHLVRTPESTFLVRAAGDSMIDANIRDGDLLVVDRKAQPKHGKIVIAAVDGALTVKFLIVKQGRTYLMPANPEYAPIPVNPETGVTIWGVVTSSVREH
jgi:DNA polymerase V